MNLFGLRFGPLDGRERDRLLASARAAAPTYDHVGSTLDPRCWAAPGVRVRHLTVGRGAAAFRAARQALRTWVPQAGIGAAVEPAGEPVVLGATVLIVLRAGRFSVVAPDRIVAVVNEPDRFGFAYGSLPGHPERGERASWRSSSTMYRPGHDPRAGGAGHGGSSGRCSRGPKAPARAMDRYLRAIADHVASTFTAEEPPGATS